MGARIKTLLLAGLATLSLGLAAPGPAPAAAERPLVYVVVVDGLDGDVVDAGGMPTVSTLLAGRGANATYFRESRSVMIAETNPNHVAMMSGAYAGSSGTAGNAFAIYADLEGEADNEAVGCTATGPLDYSKLPTVTSGENASCPVAELVFEAIRRQGNPDRLITAGIFGKAKLGRIFGGRHFDGVNRDLDHVWAPCTPSDTADEMQYCADVPIEPVTRDRTVSDSLVMDEVIRTIRQGIEVGDERRRPDLTFVNLPNVDNAGHAFGQTLPAYDTAVTLADQEIGRLVAELRARGEWERTVLVLLSDHSHEETPNPITLQSRFEAAGIDPAGFLIVQNGGVDMAYLADRTSPDRFALLQRMREAALGTNGVAEALYRELNPLDGGNVNSLDGAHPGWRAAGERTGDLFVTARPGFRFSEPSPNSNPLLGNHGAPQTLDNFLAVIGGGTLVLDRALGGSVGPLFDDALLNPGQAENVDVSSTVMGLLGFFATRDNQGRFLSEAFDEAVLGLTSAPALRPALRARRAGGSRRQRSGRRRVLYRLSWSPPGGEYDLQVLRGNHWRYRLRATTSTAQSTRLLGGRSYRFRVRARAASGVPGAWSKLRMRVR